MVMWRKKMKLFIENKVLICDSNVPFISQTSAALQARQQLAFLGV
jgi:hypothetical protein